MRNLKRALSLVMAMALIVGMMVISAGAVSKDFTDKDEIDHSEAVNTMVALNVISGKEDGSYFDPTGSLTRAEMAKVVSYVMNGGVEPNIGTKLVPTYSDIDNHWAEAYIEYCTSMGIIAGDGAGKFNPEGTLTAEQCAKMFLTAMGYNANVFGFTGNDWAINVGRYANEAGLYEDLGDIVPSNVISRDDACQMAYNAIQATMMKRSWSQDMTTGQLTETYVPWVDDTNNIPHTLLLDKFNARVYEGVLGSTGEYSTLLAAEADGFRVNVEKINGNTVSGGPDDTPFEYEDQDLSALMGQYVKVIYADNTDTCYGVYAVADKNNVLETVTSKTDYTGLTNKVKVDGVTYNLESGADLAVYVDENLSGTGFDVCKAATNNTIAGTVAANSVKFIDNDGNGKFDLVLVTRVNVAEITFMNDTTLTMSVKGAAPSYVPADLSQPLEDLIVSDGLEKGDYAIVSRDYYSDSDKLVAVDVASGTVSGVRSTGATINEWQIDGQWYKAAQGYTVNTSIKSGSSLDYVGVDGVIFYAKLTSGATLDNVAVIAEMGVETDIYTRHTTKATIIKADGSTTAVTVGALYDDVTEATDNLDNDDSSLDAGETKFIGVPVSYVEDDGSYNFYLLADTDDNRAGFDTLKTAAPSVVNGDWTIGGTVVADDAVIVIRNEAVGTNSEDGKITSISGADFKRVTEADSNDDGTGTRKFVNSGAYALIGKDANGFSRVMFAVVQASKGSTTYHGYNDTDNKFTLGTISGNNYGYLVDNSWTETIDGDNYNCFRVWNGEETVVLKEQASKASYAKRGIITYDVVDAETIKNVTSVGVTTSYVTAYTEGKAVEVGGNEYEITSDTVILNIDDANAAGVAGTSVITAREIGTTGQYYANAYFFSADGNEMNLLVVDVARNELNGSPLAVTPVASGANANTLPTVTPAGSGTVKPVATISSNPTFSTMYGGDFSGGVEGSLTSKYTAMAINVPVGTATTNVAIKLNNSALVAFSTDTRVSGNMKYSGTSVTEADGYLELSFIVQNDDQPITLEVLVGDEVQNDYAASGTASAFSTNQTKWNADVAKDGVQHYTYTIDTTGIIFQ